MDKNSFLIYLDYEEQFNLLTDEQVGQLIRAIMKYEKTKEEPKLEGMLKMAFSFIKTQLDRDREKYEEKCEKNRQNGARGGRPKKNQKEDKKPNGFKENPIKPKKADNDNDNVNDNVNDNIKEKNKEKKIHFAEFVSMTNTEHEKLVSTYGNDFTDQCIKVLDNYKGSSGKTYKNDYRAILNWVIDKVKIMTTNNKTYSQRNYGDLDFLYANKKE